MQESDSRVFYQKRPSHEKKKMVLRCYVVVDFKKRVVCPASLLLMMPSKAAFYSASAGIAQTSNSDVNNFK
jgi:hypothetical protein